MEKKDKTILAIDIGGSKLLVGLIDENGTILDSRKSLFVHPTRESVVNQIIQECHELMDMKYKPSCIGVSIPGLANSEKGIWVYACFSKIENLPLAELLEQEFKIPCFLENDANICAYGEKVFGCAKEVKDFIWITISNGIGSGLFLNNSLYEGINKNAGEVGHIKVVKNGPKCPCGGQGCLEAVAAGNGISRRYLNSTGKELSAKQIAFLAREGDKEALECFAETGEYIGNAIGTVQNLLNLPLIVLGGGVSMAYDLLQEGIDKGIKDKIFQKANKGYSIKVTELGYEAALIGAAAYALIRSESA